MPAQNEQSSAPVRFAAVGDIHGGMHAMIRLVAAKQKELGTTIDFVLQTGDFEPMRNEADLATMAAPQKYRALGDFPEFFAGRAEFPWPVYFIGGNHEPYGYLDETPDGATLIKNCHYFGRTGSADIGGLRVAGISGIHSENHYQELRPPAAEIDRHANKLYTYFNEHDIAKMLEYGQPDILLMHDWPAGIIAEADQHLFVKELGSGRFATIGSSVLRDLVDLLQPRLVLCGHMHRAYRATLSYADGTTGHVCCLPEIAAGIEAVAVFEVKGDGGIEELPVAP